MAMLPTFGGRTHMGVTIDNNWITLAKVTKVGNGSHVTATRRLKAADSSTLPAIVREMEATGLCATISVTDSLVTQRNLNLPELSPKALKQVIRRETKAERDDDNMVAWTVHHADEQSTQSVVLHIIPSTQARQWINLVRNAGLKPVGIVPNARSFITAMCRPSDLDDNELISLVEVSDNSMDVVLTRHGKGIFDRHINRGAKGISTPKNTPGTAMNAPPQGGTTDYGEVTLAEPSADPQPRTEVTDQNDHWERLGGELLRTHLYAKKNLRAGEVKRVVLAGEYPADLLTYLADTARVAVIPLSEYRSDLCWEGTADPLMVLANGAGLTGLSHAGVDSGVIPIANANRTVTPFMTTAAGVLLMFLFVFTAFGVWSEAKAVSQTQERLVGLKTSLGTLRNQVVIPTNSDGAWADNMAKWPKGFPGTTILSRLGATLPAAAQLDEVTCRWQDDRWHIDASGTIHRPTVTALREISRMMERLTLGGVFQNVVLSPTQGGEDRTAFTLSFSVEVGNDGQG